MDLALHTTRVRSGMREHPDASLPWSHRFFGAALLGRSPGTDLPLGVRAVMTWAHAEARRSASSGRSAPGQEEVLALRLAYQALKAEAATIPSGAGEAEGEHGRSAGRTSRDWAALPAVARLRHRQRAAVLLRYGLSMDERDVARVLGVRAAQVPAILACAVSTLARKAGRPVDVPQAMRRAARDPSPAPRGGEKFMAPQAEAIPSGSPVSILIAPARPAASPSRASRMRGAWSWLGRVAAAASVGLLYAWAVWPVAR